MTLEPIDVGQAVDLAALHATSFDTPWNAADIAELLEGPGGFGVVVLDEMLTPAGFILARVIVDEAEILTLAVAPAARRQGLARALVEAVAGLARARGAASLFLEVAADNPAAIGLYKSTEFAEVGGRRGYYARKDGLPVDAVVMRRDLNSGAT